MQYRNPALDLVSVGFPLATAAAKTAYDIWNTYNPTHLPTNKMVQASKKRKLVYSKNTRPFKRARPTAITKFQSKGPVTEKRWVDVTSTLGFTTSLSNTALLNGLSTGTDFYHRLGHNYVNTSIHFNGHIIPNLTNPTDIISWAIVYDRQANSSAPAWSDVFQGTTNAGVASNTPLSNFNIENSDRFLIIAHETRNTPNITVASGVTSGIGFVDPTQPFHINVFKKLNLPTRCDGDTASVADIISGSIYLMTIGLNATASWSLNYSCRIRFEC